MPANSLYALAMELFAGSPQTRISPMDDEEYMWAEFLIHGQYPVPLTARVSLLESKDLITRIHFLYWLLLKK